MKIGLSLTTAYSRAEPAVERFRQLVQQVEVARDHGFHSIWVGDHHITPDVYYQSVPTIARLSAHAGSMQIGPFLLLPLYQPVLLAEQMATLDVITGGRLTLMVALGWQPEAYAALGIPWKERVPRFVEALEVLRLLFAKDVADYRGRFYRFEHVASPNRSMPASRCGSGRAPTRPFAVRRGWATPGSSAPSAHWRA
jgi:alkanesulfonate monooxygenase SsuD/methylene tetrahydromethanopterin reductase-like flavin-dependent oxidoreductase (luciferase family)